MTIAELLARLRGARARTQELGADEDRLREARGCPRSLLIDCCPADVRRAIEAFRDARRDETACEEALCSLLDGGVHRLPDGKYLVAIGCDAGNIVRECELYAGGGP